MDADRPWPFAARVGFRRFACYFTLYLLQFPLLLPGISSAWDALRKLVLPWVGRTVFSTGPVPVAVQSGSGDTLADYLLMFLFAVLSLVGAAVWTLRRDAKSHPRVAAWLLLLMRYFLAMALMIYGLAKVFMSQMPPPDAFRLTQTFGDLSPMGLLWAFTGASRPYEIFGGLAELIPGVLLIFRRSALLGALLAVPVLVNVVLLNFSYDVPVKLFSTHLLVMSIALLAPQARRLYGLVWANTVVQPAHVAPLVTDGRLLTLGKVVQGIMMVLVLAAGATMAVGSRKQPVAAAEDGAWRIASFDGPIGRGQWESLVIDRRRVRFKRSLDDALWLTLARVDSTSFRMASPNNAGVGGTSKRLDLVGELRGARMGADIVRREADTMLVRGVQGNDSVRAVLVRRDLSKMELVSRGFHWIQEYPRNR